MENLLIFAYAIVAIIFYGLINGRLIAYGRPSRVDAIVLGGLWPVAIAAIVTSDDPNPFKHPWKP